MNARKMLAIAGFIAFTLAGGAFALPEAADAETLLSPVVAIGGPNTYFVCRMVNAGTKGITVTIELRNIDGTVIDAETVPIPPDSTGYASLNGFGPGYCRFSGNFNKGVVRASAETYDNASLRSVLVVPAH